MSNRMIHPGGLFRGLLILALFLPGLLLWGCGERAETSEDRKRATRTGEVKKVKAVRVRAAPPEGSIEYVGTLAAFRKVMIASEVSGAVEKLYFEKGDRVKKGQVLAEIGTSTMRLRVQEAKAAVAAAKSNLEKVETGSRPEEIQIAEAGVAEAEAALLEAEQNFRRIKALYETSAASNSEYDAARKGVDMARARVEAARHQLSLARQGPREEDRKTARANLEQARAALALAKDGLRKSILRAPCNGIIAFREVEEGEVIVIPPVTVITQIVDLDRLKVKVSIAEKDIHVLEAHKTFPFTLDAFPHEKFSCRLFFRSPTADPATRSFPVEFLVEDPDPRMADGMTIRLKLPVTDVEKRIKTPSAWLTEEDGEIGLFVVSDGKALFKNVTLGTYYDQRVEILSGLEDQELVITNPAGLRTGTPVKCE